jgi:DNA-binding transcriptional MerR regulator
MKHPVEHERGKKFVGLPEFAAVCERVMSELDLEQVRGTVTSVPDERTIRYYLAEGLIQSSEERQGTASVFGYLNVLQLVAVKKLQAEHLPIRKIRELVDGKNEQELETLLGVGAQSGKRPNDSEAKRYLESLLAPSMSRLPGSNTRPRSASMSAADQSAVPASAPEQTGAWQRLEIEPGLELHIRSDYTPPTTSARTRSLTDRIRSAMNRYWRGK